MTRKIFAILVLSFFLLTAHNVEPVGGANTEDVILKRISVGLDGEAADSNTLGGGIDHSGRFVVFASMAENIVEGKSNKCPTDPRFPDTPCREIFLYDRIEEEIRRLHMGYDGSQLNGRSYDPVISADGRWVAFKSDATNLVTGTTNNNWNVFVTNVETGETHRVSVDSQGNEQERNDRMLCSWACGRVSISSDGRFIMFDSWAENLVEGDTNERADVFVHDTVARTTERVSIGQGGVEGNDPSWNPSTQGISGDGRYVVFHSVADNLVEGITNRCDAEIPVWQGISCLDIFLHDRAEGTLERLSVDNEGNEHHAASSGPAISGDGRFVAFSSEIKGLVQGVKSSVEQVYVKDLETRDFEIISVNNNGIPGNGVSWGPLISHDGRFVTFITDADNLFPGTNPPHAASFVRDRENQVTVPLVLTEGGKLPQHGAVGGGRISGDGQWITFASDSHDILDGVPGQWEVYLTNQHMKFIQQALSGELETVEETPYSATFVIVGVLMLAGLILRSRWE